MKSNYKLPIFQKYRLYLRRLSGVSQHQNGLSNSFMGPPDASFGPISSADLQALAASGQIPPHSLATIQAAAFGRANSKPLIDQRNILGYENQKQVSLLHGFPTGMDSKQLAKLQQSGNSLLIQMVQPQSRAQMSNIPSSVGQPVSSQDNVCGPSFSSQSDFSGRQDEVNAEAKVSRGFVPNYDVFNDPNQNRTQDWRLQNVGPHQHLNQQRFSSNQKSGQQLSSSVSDIPVRIKAERLPDMGLQNSLFTQRFGQEDLMSAILKQVCFFQLISIIINMKRKMKCNI